MPSISKLSRLPTDISRAIGKIRHTQFGYDRFKVWFDHPEPELPLEELKKHCGNVVFHTGAMLFNPQMQSALEIFQPSRKALKVFSAFLNDAPYVAQINSIEIACDFITDTYDDADALQNCLLQRIYIPSWQQPVKQPPDTETYYFGRSKLGDQKAPKNLVLYADKPSKLAGPQRGLPCAHIEFRLHGSASVGKAHIVTIDSLLTFDHEAFWAKNIKLLQWSSLAQLGKYVTEDNPDVTDAALRKQAHAFLGQHEIGGIYIMQNAILDMRELTQITKLIEPGLVFKKSKKRDS